jgi:hypothetical protein
MLQRCKNKNIPGYRYYGGRGIRVCKRWKSFEGFKTWAFAAGYSDMLEIDRIDSNGNYEPSNCQWVTRVFNAKKAMSVRAENFKLKAARASV